MNVRIYVEGGGDHNKVLDTECRRGFREFFPKSRVGRPHAESHGVWRKRWRLR